MSPYPTPHPTQKVKSLYSTPKYESTDKMLSQVQPCKITQYLALMSQISWSIFHVHHRLHAVSVPRGPQGGHLVWSSVAGQWPGPLRPCRHAQPHQPQTSQR